MNAGLVQPWIVDPISEKLRFERIGIDQHHLDTKGFKLLRQRFRQAFHSEFRGVVNAGSSMANESRDRREVDQHALALPQMRKGSPSDADKPEEEIGRAACRERVCQ